eukprot:CAMPEP_0194371990 /NCGR_PEP_ID=MMETSP0174-20130528/20301_1 /TAXON_ID=216777 /ORGANISM="Proboscia alata, Strain PI-D3" /LENGTH=294 /DNA_ID=CAMNT_0039150245 /DNA_START=106 /DNA_END=990 /DNA_ORIENTATION=-
MTAHAAAAVVAQKRLIEKQRSLFRVGSSRRSWNDDDDETHRLDFSDDDYDKVIKALKDWATLTKENSITASGAGLARLIEKITENGRITREDESLIREILANQQGWWTLIILMDTLIMSVIMPLLIYEKHSDNGHFSETTTEIIVWAYYFFLTFTFYMAILQLFLTMLLWALSSFLFEVQSILFMLVRFHSLLTYMNNGGLAIVPGLIIAPLLGHVLMVGPYQSIPGICFGSFTLFGGFYLYLAVIKPIFMDLFKSQSAEKYAWMENDPKFDMNSRKSDVNEEQPMLYRELPGA